ncbi:Uncharacterised protein [Vibrio cholerae]|nr:Uncharacterised protein [Vibrio cholerae]CSD02765.1 Uncharacterised protein [Vibrio cholerae]
MRGHTIQRLAQSQTSRSYRNNHNAERRHHLEQEYR